jgi:hypothetical protein
MMALPAALLKMLSAIPDAWPAIEAIATYIAHGGDPNDARVRAEAVAAHALLRARRPK